MFLFISHRNRGFCFVTYTSRDEAKAAVRDLNNFEIREKRYIGKIVIGKKMFFFASLAYLILNKTACCNLTVSMVSELLSQ